MESRAEMLERHARELAELDSRWWEEWFTEDPNESWYRNEMSHLNWCTRVLPTIIRKREKIGLYIHVNFSGCASLHFGGSLLVWLDNRTAEELAGRTLAPGEKVDL